MSEPRRLFAAALPDDGGEVRLDAAAARHARVLRLEPGAAIVLFDGAGGEADGALLALDADGARAQVGARRTVVRDAPVIVLCLGLPKGKKLDDIVRACTELGVTAIHLATCARSVPRLDLGRADKRLARLEAIAQEAARQSLRADVPVLHPPASLDAIAARVPPHAARVVFAPGHPRELEAALDAAAEAWVVVGPEGGLAPDELSTLGAQGFRAIGLGPTVLRVETAAPVAVALVAHALANR